MSPRRKGDGAPIRLVLTTALEQHVRSSAEAMDLSMNGYLTGLVAGALRTGQAERLVMEGLKNGQLSVKRKPRPRRWTNVADGIWQRDDYMISRVGHGNSRRPAGTGWYLEGPGVERTHVGFTAREAQTNADAIVDARSDDLELAAERTG